MSDSAVGPRDPCPRCKGVSFKKKISVVQRALGARSENSVFPMRLRHLERPRMRDDGVIVRDPVIFRNEHEYNEHLSKHDLVRMCDGEDPMVGDSQHSVYDAQAEAGPPSARAAEMANKAYFVESPDEVNFA